MQIDFDTLLINRAALAARRGIQFRPISHRGPDGSHISCQTCRLFFNRHGIPQRAWLKMSACARSVYAATT